MIRNLKALGLALAAFLALGATIAAAPAAAEFEFHSDGPTTLVAEGGPGIWSSQFGEMECKSVSYHGEMSGATEEEIELEQINEECSVGGIGTIVEDWNGCRYRFEPWKKTAGPLWDTTDYFKCPPGKTYTKTFYLFGTLKCTQHAPSQFLGFTEWTKAGVWNRKWKALEYVQTSGTGFGFCEAGEFNDGEYTDEGDLDGENSESQETEFWIE